MWTLQEFLEIHRWDDAAAARRLREIALGEVLHVAFARWDIERMFEDGEGEVGLDHFEVRNYRPLIRHLLLATA